MRQIIHYANLGSTPKDPSDIDLLRVAPSARHSQQRNRLKIPRPLVDIAAPLRLQECQYDVHAARLKVPRVLEHLIGFAYAGGISQVNL
jgi:hypothetical protein